MLAGLAASVLASPSLAGAIGGKKDGESSQVRTGPIRQEQAGGDIVFNGKGSGGDWIWLVVLALFIFAFVQRS